MHFGDHTGFFYNSQVTHGAWEILFPTFVSDNCSAYIVGVTINSENRGGKKLPGLSKMCLCWLVLAAAYLTTTSNTKSQAVKNQKKIALKIHTLSNLAPGGPLGISSIPSEVVLAMPKPHVEQHLNATYWQIVPYIVPVCCGPRS